MSEEKQATKQEAVDGETVYRRVAPQGEDKSGGASSRLAHQRKESSRKIAPALSPLIIGFALLLALVLALGYLSERQLEDVSRNVLNLEQQHAAKLSLLLRVRVALVNLNNEASERHQAESQGGITTPFELRLINARRELTKLLDAMENPELRQSQQWQQLLTDVSTFIEITKDLKRFSLEGFIQFRKADAQLKEMLNDATNREQNEILLQREEMHRRARRTIYLLTLIAVLTGALVAAGTIREVQRRFRQMHRSLDEARREREFSTQILEGMVSALAAIDSHDRIRSANAAFFDIFPQATIGASVHDAFASPQAMKMLEAATSSRVERATYRGRWVCGMDDPSCIDKTFDVYSSPLEIDGDHGQIVTLVDATAAAETEHAMRRSEALSAVGRASAQVAHEIKNPLGSIRLGVSMLRDMINNPEAHNTINLVERGINHLNKLVVDVTQFSSQRALERAETDLRELIESSIELVSERVKETSVSFDRHYDEQSLKGNWDADQLRQVFVNLLANAIDASPSGSPISITTEHVRNERGQQGNGHQPAREKPSPFLARTIIADKGNGMDEATRARIFEPFFSTKKRGTGLGLAIVKQIVDEHGGTVSARSQQGEGTQFIVDLPMNS